MLATLGGSVPLLAALLQAHWHTTPGKRLFQLRIVDWHGLTPRNVILAIRSVFQFLPLWAAALHELNRATGRPFLGAVLAAIIALWLIGDVVWSVFSRKGLSLHDRIFKTRVVLDVPAVNAIHEQRQAAAQPSVGVKPRAIAYAVAWQRQCEMLIKICCRAEKGTHLGCSVWFRQDQLI